MAANKNLGKAEVIYECGHKRTFQSPYPSKGDEVFCFKCQNETRVADGVDELYRVKCQSCRWGRMFGADKIGASRLASRHATRFPDHIVDVLLNGATVLRVGNQCDELPYETVIKERHAVARSNQEMLRKSTTVTKPLP